MYSGWHLDLAPDTTDTVWIGAREADPTVESGWVWDLTGRAIDQTMWYPGQPNNYQGRQDHMCLWKGQNGYHDCAETDRYIFLCETPAEYLTC